MAFTLAGKCIAVAGIAAVLIAGGAFGAWRLSQSAEAASPPYAYEADQAEPSAEAAKLAALAPGATASVLEVKAPGFERAVATAQVLTLPGAGDVIVGWTSEVGEPVLRSDISEREELALITALNKHLPQGSTVLAMPAVSARLAHFVAADFPLAAAVGQEALRVPASWAGREDEIETLETRWLADGGAPDGSYADFIDALLAEDVYGAARLQTLAGPRDTYIILHMRDVFDLGLDSPDRLLVGLRDFPAAGQVHDKSRAVKEWAKAQGHVAYAVERREGGVIRAYYLTDAKDKSTLLGQLLPFNTADLGRVAGTTLVFQTGGYWIYRLQPVVDRT
ncbi:hydroxylamine oxidation protein HaoB [Roseovarius spongiae]|uniref:Hydroxylamine oxidation protein HaoB n=1 Tax=Roseovarius spongiae TaxID=2320272 RepID=A0A3A8ART6_9RHOB|nr:hydroxylamine oxidation protein HaoB [Roseovarius spongiae]RKF12852.1 hydroxylamine oxidation protein HaoB [Roseovarius spongiae]